MLERSKQGLIGRGLPKDQKRANIIRGWIAQDGDISSESQIAPSVGKAKLSQAEAIKIYPEIPLEAEMERQAKIYMEREFHKHKNIGMPRGRFKDLIMGLVVPQPESFKGTFDTPFVKFGQIPVKDQCKLAGISYLLDGFNVRDWPDDPQNYSTPKATYIVWTDEGARFMNRRMQDVRQELAVHERGGTEFDGVGLYIAKPDILKTRFLDLPGTSVGSGSAAALHLWLQRPWLDGHWVGYANSEFGSLVCGREK